MKIFVLDTVVNNYKNTIDNINELKQSLREQEKESYKELREAIDEFTAQKNDIFMNEIQKIKNSGYMFISPTDEDKDSVLNKDFLETISTDESWIRDALEIVNSLVYHNETYEKIFRSCSFINRNYTHVYKLKLITTGSFSC